MIGIGADQPQVWKVSAVAARIASQEHKISKLGMSADVKVRERRCLDSASPAIFYEGLPGEKRGLPR
jgi:hypothetical protein